MQSDDTGMNVARSFARGALVYFVVVGVIGVFLRARYVAPLWPPLPFTNLVHAHSHVAYFGWTSLGLIAIIYAMLPKVTGRPLQGRRLIRWQLTLTHVATVGALVFFSLGGYTPVSIVFSTFNVLLWYLFMRIYWLNVRGLSRPLPVALRYWHGAVALLFVSSLGTWLVSAMTAAKGPMWAQQAGINIFLTNFTDGWLILGLFGAAAAWLTPDAGRWAAGPLPWMLVLTPFTFLAELVPFSLPTLVLVAGLVARYGLTVPYVWFLLNVRAAYRSARAGAGQQKSGTLHGFATAAFAYFAAKAVIHFVLGIAAVVPSRHMFVAYLHLDLLGFVSCGLLAMLYVALGSTDMPRRNEMVNDQGLGPTPSGAPAVAGRAGVLVLSVGLVPMVVTLAVIAVVGGSTDAAARAAVNDLLQAAFVFAAVSFLGVLLSAAGLWPHTAAAPSEGARSSV